LRRSCCPYLSRHLTLQGKAGQRIDARAWSGRRERYSGVAPKTKNTFFLQNRRLPQLKVDLGRPLLQFRARLGAACGNNDQTLIRISDPELALSPATVEGSAAFRSTLAPPRSRGSRTCRASAQRPPCNWRSRPWCGRRPRLVGIDGVRVDDRRAGLHMRRGRLAEVEHGADIDASTAHEPDRRLVHARDFGSEKGTRHPALIFVKRRRRSPSLPGARRFRPAARR